MSTPLPPITMEELWVRLNAWLNAEAVTNPATVEAEHHLEHAALADEVKQAWREAFGDTVFIRVTDARLDRFFADNPDVLPRCQV